MTDFIKSMSAEAIVAIAAGAFVSLAMVVFLILKYFRRFKSDHFAKKWKSLQQKLPNKDSWRDAVIEADDLLGEALKKKKIKGKTTGERMVNAQKSFSDNDAVWFGHKLRKKLDNNPSYKPKKQEVKKALLALRGGLKDIGAM
jgi:cell division protein FtsN